MAYLNFIEDKKLIRAVKLVIDKILEIKEGNTEIERNQLDPFGALFECIAGECDYEEWVVKERVRQAQKSIQNTIGDFHQELIGGLQGCCSVPEGEGLDILNVEQAWCAEIKNKYNTTKGNHKAKLYDDIEKWINQYTFKYSKQFKGYYVEIIPRKAIDLDVPFVPSDQGRRRPRNEYIRQISGSFFYEMITGEKNALLNLYNQLPLLIKNEFGIQVKLSKSLMEKLFNENIKTIT